MIHELYVALHNQLFGKLTESNLEPFGLPPLLWVDRFNNQFEKILVDDGHDMFPIRFPAILIEFGEIAWKSTGGKGIQQADSVPITFHVGYENYADSYQTQVRDGFTTGFSGGFATGFIGGSNNQALALNDLRYLEQVHAALQGFAPLGGALLDRTLSRFDNDYGNLIVNQLEYSLQLNEAIVRDVTQVVLADLCPIPSLPTPPAWLSFIGYMPGQKVTWDKDRYICVQETIAGTAPSNEVYWRQYYGNDLYIIV